MEFETVLDGIWTYITEALKPFPPKTYFCYGHHNYITILEDMNN